MKAIVQAGRDSSRGFTLVELLVTIVILGILVTIALNVTKSKDKAYLAVMQSDLHTLALAEEAYYADHGMYAQNNAVNFTPSQDVVLVVSSNAGGWSARAQHQMRTDVWCAMYVGSPNPIYQPAQEAGVISCGPKGGGGGNGGGNGGGKP